MPTYIALMNFTEQGARAIADTRKRADAFRSMAEKAGASVKEVYWTLGHHDGVLILDAPGDEAVASLLFQLAALGNVRTQTLRAFDATEVDGILPRGAAKRR